MLGLSRIGGSNCYRNPLEMNGVTENGRRFVRINVFLIVINIISMHCTGTLWCAEKDCGTTSNVHVTMSLSFLEFASKTILLAE